MTGKKPTVNIPPADGIFAARRIAHSRRQRMGGIYSLVVAAGVLLNLWAAGCGNEKGSEQTAGDSALLPAAHAQTAQEGRWSQNEKITDSRHTAITEAVAHVSPAVVGINVTQVQKFVQRNPFANDPFWGNLFPELYRGRIFERQVKSLGSGFLISEDGYIVTNEHVVENATKILVTMSDGKRLDARLVGEDPATDVALLKLEGHGYPYIPMGHSDDLMVGEWVIALGNPFGLFELSGQPTVTVGVISAVNRDWGRTEDGRLYLDMIQTDAAINHGNSGGPLVNAEGQVIGMNTFIFTGSQYQDGFIGIGFAIPIDKITEVVNLLKSGKKVDRDYWLGILDVQSLDPRIVAALDLPISEGAIITQVEEASPARRAGLREYDVVVGIDDTAVTGRRSFWETLRNMDLKVGSQLTFSIVRGSQRMKITLTLTPLPKRR